MADTKVDLKIANSTEKDMKLTTTEKSVSVKQTSSSTMPMSETSPIKLTASPTDKKTLSIQQGTSGGNTVNVGTNDYNELINKPKINGTELIGDVSLEDLGFSSGTEDYDVLIHKPKINGVELSGDVSLEELGALTSVPPQAIEFAVNNKEFGVASFNFQFPTSGDVESVATAVAQHSLYIYPPQATRSVVTAFFDKAESEQTLGNEFMESVFKRAKELNPNLRIGRYVQVEAERKANYTGAYKDADGNNLEYVYLNSDGSWDGSTAQVNFASGRLTAEFYNFDELKDHFKMFKKQGFDLVFFDDFDWGWNISSTCYQMGYDTSQFSTNNEAKNQKFKDLIAAAHEIGLGVVTNGAFHTEVGDWYTTLTEDDVVALESYLFSSAGPGQINYNEKTIYGYYTSYYLTGKCKAKFWSLDYYPNAVSNDLKRAMQTYEIAAGIACGCNYVSLGVSQYLPVPELFQSLVVPKNRGITYNDTLFSAKIADHTLAAYKPSGFSGAIVTEKIIQKFYVQLDGDKFTNAYLNAPSIDYDLESKIDDLSTELETGIADTKDSAKKYLRLVVDDWTGNLDYTDYTNLVSASDSVVSKHNTTSTKLVTNADGTLDLVITYDAVTANCNPDILILSYSRISELGLFNHSYEFGWENIIFDLNDDCGLNLDDGTVWYKKGSTLSSDKWPQPEGMDVYINASSTSVNASGWAEVSSDIFPGGDTGHSFQYKFGETTNEKLDIHLWTSPAKGTSITGTITIKNLYCVDLEEHANDIVKDWYTNVYPTGQNSHSGLGQVFTTGKTNGRITYDITGTSTDAWGWSLYRYTADEVASMAGKTYEFGAMSISKLSSGVSGKVNESGTGGKNWKFGVGINSDNPTTYLLYYDTSKTSAVWEENIPCVQFKVPDDCTKLTIGMQSYGLDKGNSMTVTGAYLYCLDEDVTIRGRDFTHIAYSLGRTSNEEESEHPLKLSNTMVIIDNGDAYMTKANGDKVFFGRMTWITALLKMLVANGTLSADNYKSITGEEYSNE